MNAIQLFNSLGYPVLSQSYQGKGRIEIQLPTGLPAGLYVLRLQLQDGKIHTQKILLQP